MNPVRHGLCRGFFFSGLVSALREERDCFWLIDAIGSHYSANPRFRKKLEKNDRLSGFHIWWLKSNGEGGAILECRADTDDPIACKQEIEYTDWDFKKFGEAKFYAGYTQIGSETGYYLYLPEEY